MKFLEGGIMNREFRPSWVRAAYNKLEEDERGVYRRSIIWIYRGTWEAVDARSMSFDTYQVRAFAHEAVHALGRRATPHEAFPTGIWMGVGPDVDP